MDRREFLQRVGVTSLALPVCLGALSGCGQANVVPDAPTHVDFTIDVSSGALAQNGGYLVKNGVLVARTITGDFLAVSAACTHQGTTVRYVGSQNYFYCPNHGATFSSAGSVTRGPATRSLAEYKTALSGSSLRIFS